MKEQNWHNQGHEGFTWWSESTIDNCAKATQLNTSLIIVVLYLKSKACEHCRNIPISSVSLLSLFSLYIMIATYQTRKQTLFIVIYLSLSFLTLNQMGNLLMDERTQTFK